MVIRARIIVLGRIIVKYFRNFMLHKVIILVSITYLAQIINQFGILYTEFTLYRTKPSRTEGSLYPVATIMSNKLIILFKSLSYIVRKVYKDTSLSQTFFQKLTILFLCFIDCLNSLLLYIYKQTKTWRRELKYWILYLFLQLFSKSFFFAFYLAILKGLIATYYKTI